MLKDLAWHTADDQTLLEQLRKGDRDAFACIYKRYYPMLYPFAMRYVKSEADAEDVLQQVFVKLWTVREALFVTSSLKGYLFSMTKYQVLNFIRNSNNALQHNYRICQQQPAYDDDLYTYAERHHRVELLDEAIRKLPAQQRKVATMRCEGYSNQEIAQRLGLSIHTVNTHYRECIKTLKAFLAGIVKFFIIYLFWNL